MFSTKSLVCALAISSLMAGGVQAATSTWTGGGDGTSWTDDTNWDVAPTDDGTTDVIFSSKVSPAAGVTIELGGDHDINSLTFSSTNVGGVGGPDGGSYTLGDTVGGNTLTVQSGTLSIDTYGGGPIINSDVLLGADGTTGTQQYHHSLVLNGSLGETGGSRSLKLITDGGRSTYINGDSTYTGATTVVSGRENFISGSSQTSSVTVTGGRFGVRDASGLGSGAFSISDAGYVVGGQNFTINNPTSLGGQVLFTSLTSYGNNFVTPFTDTSRGRGQVTFANPVTLTSDTTINPAQDYREGSAPVFAGGFTGAHSLTIDGESYVIIDGASTYTGGTTIAKGNVVVSADGGLGLGDVSVSGNDALLRLDSSGTIAPDATLTLADDWSLDLNFSGTQTVGGLVVDGTAFAAGTYTASDIGGGASGDGSLLVVPIPEPASLALLGLGGLALIGRRRRGINA